KGGSPIGGATNSSYTINNLSGANNGAYDVLVTNNFGSTSSPPVSILVSPQGTPVFSQNIVITNRTVYPGGSIKLAVGATGGGITYQWRKNALALAGQTGATLTLAGVTNGNAGAYAV